MAEYDSGVYGTGKYGPGIFDRMRRYVPPLYADDSLLLSVLAVEATEFDSIRANLIDIVFQTFTATVNGWGLVFWESLLGLHPSATDTDDTRRSRIQAAVRGIGQPRRPLLEQLAINFQNGLVDIVEDFANKAVRITFASALGVPANISDFQSYMRSIVPGHLDVVYVFRYTTWSQWDAHNLTWAGTDALALSWPQHDIYG
jgi:hypothetical protein